MTASNLAQLKKEFSQVSKTANARIDSLKRGRYKSPAVEKLRENGIKRFGVKSMKLKTEADYRKAIRQAKNFLNSETSTRKGLKKVTREMMKNFGITKKGGEGLSSITRKAKRLFNLYDDLKELANKGQISIGDKYEVVEMMSEMLEDNEIDMDMTASEILDKLKVKVQEKKNLKVTRQSQLNFQWSV